ncbi:unnamed protein product [Prunus armeniaca]|uniref:Uncharacterized protein n=1 Tax=Prunus armeniaca TaxID=36596 RepID=A0A6J5VA39_PRUAR|nr:unnamed protein product [Prunus armeniaca]
MDLEWKPSACSKSPRSFYTILAVTDVLLTANKCVNNHPDCPSSSPNPGYGCLDKFLGEKGREKEKEIKKGSSKAIWQFYCVVLLLASAFAPSTSWWIYKGLTRDYVRIVNNLINQQLQYQCNSKDNDFGLRSLPPKGEYEWGFRVIF